MEINITSELDLREKGYGNAAIRQFGKTTK
jgi:hypothetical protein